MRSPPRAPSLFDLTSHQLSQQTADWLISWDEIELGRRIGAGSYGEVFRAQWRHTDVAVKRISHVNESFDGVSQSFSRNFYSSNENGSHQVSIQDVKLFRRAGCGKSAHEH